MLWTLSDMRYVPSTIINLKVCHKKSKSYYLHQKQLCAIKPIMNLLMSAKEAALVFINLSIDQTMLSKWNNVDISSLLLFSKKRNATFLKGSCCRCHSTNEPISTIFRLVENLKNKVIVFSNFVFTTDSIAGNVLQFFNSFSCIVEKYLGRYFVRRRHLIRFVSVPVAKI